MSDRIRVLATGELQTGDLRLQFVPLDSYDFIEWFSEEALAEAFDLAMAHGAVLFEFDYAEPETGEQLSGMGFDAAEGQADWRKRILLCVEGPCVRLRTPALDQLLVAQRRQSEEPAGSHFFMALMPAAELDLDQQAGILPTFIRALPASADGQPPVWQLGPDMTLQALRLPVAQRDWDWAWRGATWGPVYLWIVVDRTAEQLSAWLAGLAPHGYQLVEPFEYRIDPALEDYDGRLSFADGIITFVRSYHSPGDVVQALDARLLASIAAGELGEISWDLCDGDYFHYFATGEGLGSLREYLDPNSDEAQLRSRWRSLLAQQTVDARAAENWQQVAERVLRHFQADTTEPDPRDGLEQWLRTAPMTSLPRKLHLLLSRAVYDTYQTDAFPARMREANRRIIWSVGT